MMLFFPLLLFYTAKQQSRFLYIWNIKLLFKFEHTVTWIFKETSELHLYWTIWTGGFWAQNLQNVHPFAGNVFLSFVVSSLNLFWITYVCLKYWYSKRINISRLLYRHACVWDLYWSTNNTRSCVFVFVNFYLLNC